MISDITYQANRTRIDDFLRQAAEQRMAKEATLRPDVSPAQMSRRPRRRPAPLRRILRGLDPRPAPR